jgi:hypothetical protein
MAEKQVAEPVGPNAGTPRGAPPEKPNAIAQGKGPISFPDPGAGKAQVDGLNQPAEGDAYKDGEQPHPPAPNDQVAENQDARDNDVSMG